MQFTSNADRSPGIRRYRFETWLSSISETLNVGGTLEPESILLYLTYFLYNCMARMEKST